MSSMTKSSDEDSFVLFSLSLFALDLDFLEDASPGNPLVSNTGEAGGVLSGNASSTTRDGG